MLSFVLKKLAKQFKSYKSILGLTIKKTKLKVNINQLSEMKIINLLIVVLSIVVLSACSESNQNNDPVRIAYIEREELAPARWEFIADTELSITSYQWSFSDESFLISGLNQQERVSHTFAEPGVHRIRLSYLTDTGSEGNTESEVLIGSGSISGRILAAANNLVDLDTRDPAEPNQGNNSFETAQVITATSQLSGVVDEQDPEDFYQLQLQEFQTLNVKIADANRLGRYESIRLELYHADNLVNPVLEVETDRLTGMFAAPALVPDTASYYLKLVAVNPRVVALPGEPVATSHGIYSLILEPANINQEAEFALGEINILLKENRQYKAQAMSSKINLGRFKTLSLDNAHAMMGQANIRYSAQLSNNDPSNNSGNKSGNDDQRRKWETLQAVTILQQHEDILFAEPNWKRYPTAVPVITDPFYPSQWHYESINVSQAWQVLDSLGSENVTVAVLDTGVLTAHPDLSANLIAGYDYVDDDSDANDPGDKSISGQRSSFHGTHVAGTIAAAANGVGVTGVAPNVKILPVRVLGQGGGFNSDIIAGVCFSAQLNSTDGVGCGNNNSSSIPADVINLSLGGPGFSNIEQAVYDAVIAKGIIVIAAAGNESTSTSSYPAAYDKVISVAAVGRTLQQASYSNFGSTIDVAAPGGDFSIDRGILSSWGDDLNGSAILTYGSLQGTSMAAPHVAGVAALMKSAKADLTHVEFLNYLNAGELTQDLGSEGRDDLFGYGLIDAQKSVLKVHQDLGPQILSSNNSLFFNVSESDLNFIISAGGVNSENELGDISAAVFDAIKDDGRSWLSLNQTAGLGSYTATVDRSDLLEGSYEGRIVISSTLEGIADLIITVQLQVGNPELSANAGIQYVVINDADAIADDEGIFPTIAGSSALIASDGEYSYQIFGLKKGRYNVATGSDLDFDNIICDAGESCGQYPTLNQPKFVTITEEDRHLNVNMSVNYLNSNSSTMSQGFTVHPIGFAAYKKPSSPLKLKSK